MVPESDSEESYEELCQRVCGCGVLFGSKGTDSVSLSSYLSFLGIFLLSLFLARKALALLSLSPTEGRRAAWEYFPRGLPLVE